MLFERQKLLLTFLDAIGSPVTNADFQARLFLFSQEQGASPSYEFVPQKLGAFSFTAEADKRRLWKAGLLAEDDQQWRLTEAGQQAAKAHPVNPQLVEGYFRKTTGLDGDALIAEQYRRYPYYATQSEVINNLPLETEVLRRIHEARPARGKPGLLTIGYEGKCLESYLNQLLRAGVTLLCDVRRNPLSRKYGFSKGALSKACEAVGIRYEHLPELGIASDKRRNLETQADYDALFAVYEREDLPTQGEALAKIRGWMDQGERVALTCFEAMPCQCHRHCVSEALEKVAGMTTLHL